MMIRLTAKPSSRAQLSVVMYDGRKMLGSATFDRGPATANEVASWAGDRGHSEFELVLLDKAGQPISPDGPHPSYADGEWHVDVWGLSPDAVFEGI